MQRQHKNILRIALIALTPIFAAQISSAQITGQVQANIHHSFIIGNTTLPPGQYMLRMLPGSDLNVMTITNDKNDTGVEFLVRESILPTPPQRTELIFNRYGNKEFLTGVYEAGNKYGVAVAESSRAELRLQKQGQHPVEHAETQ